MTADPHQWPEPTRESLLAQLRESRERDRAGEQTPTADLTAILAEHRQNAVVETVGRTRVKCDGETCDFYVHHRSYWRAVELHDTHLAEQITAAGFGPVRAVEAERDEALRVLAKRTGSLDMAIASARRRLERAEQAEAERDALRERITALANVPYGSDDWGILRDGVRYIPATVLHRLLDASPDREGSDQ